MFIGSTYQRRDIYNADDLGQNSDEMTHIMDHTNLGYAHIRIKERGWLSVLRLRHPARGYSDGRVDHLRSR